MRLITEDQLRDVVASTLKRMDATLRRGTLVYDWPEDEAAMHRRHDWPSYTHRAAGVELLRQEKLADALVADLLGDQPGGELEIEPIQRDRDGNARSHPGDASSNLGCT